MSGLQCVVRFGFAKSSGFKKYKNTKQEYNVLQAIRLSKAHAVCGFEESIDLCIMYFRLNREIYK